MAKKGESARHIAHQHDGFALILFMNNNNIESSKLDDSFWTNSKFGAKGWQLIVFSGFMMFFSTGVTIDGMNIYVPALAEKNGWSLSLLIGYGTIAGLAQVASLFFTGILLQKKGVRIVAFLSMAISGISFITMGFSKSPLVYAIALIGTFISMSGWMAGGVYISKWFPRKKGIALGWASMWNNLATAAFAPLIMGLLALTKDISKAMAIVGAAMICLSLISIRFPGSPERAGCTPDNVPMTDAQLKDYAQANKDFVSPWTLKRLLRTGAVWQISLSIGLVMATTVGVMSQIIPRLMTKGFTQGGGVLLVTACAIFGFAGSYIWGQVDARLGTRKAATLYILWFAVAIAIGLMPYTITLYISVFMVVVSLGGGGNWVTSLTTSVFGHQNAPMALTIINPIFTGVRFLGFSILAISLTVTGSLEGAHLIFIAMNILAALLAFTINDTKYADGNIPT